MCVNVNDCVEKGVQERMIKKNKMDSIHSYAINKRYLYVIDSLLLFDYLRADVRSK